jgi:hypothetical protein
MRLEKEEEESQHHFVVVVLGTSIGLENIA